jgi:hypothetical protein
VPPDQSAPRLLRKTTLHRKNPDQKVRKRIQSLPDDQIRASLLAHLGTT